MARFAARKVVVTLGRTQVVRGVDVVLGDGEIVGLLGPSGAGKSTLFRALVGELPTSAGAVKLGEVDIGGMPLWKRARLGLGYVPQTPSVLVDLTVRDNLLAFETLASDGGGGDRRERPSGSGEGADLGRPVKGPNHWAALVELSHQLDVRAGELSGGERRRLELVRALVARPRILICDEPFAGIDPGGAERMGQLLCEQAQDGMSILFADHHVDEALRICTRAILLLDGSVVVDGPPEVFRDHPLVRGRYLGSWYRSLPPQAHDDEVRGPTK